MKNFLIENNVTAMELPRLKEKMMEKFFSRDQWYNRYKGLTPLSRTERDCMMRALMEIRQELQQLMSPRPLDELDDAHK